MSEDGDVEEEPIKEDDTTSNHALQARIMSRIATLAGPHAVLVETPFGVLSEMEKGAFLTLCRLP